MILTLGGAGQTTTLGGAVVLAGSTTIGTGHTLDVSASNYQITISSWFANNGTFTARIRNGRGEQHGDIHGFNILL